MNPSLILPATENLNDQPENTSEQTIKDKQVQKTNLGNTCSDDEKQREKIITP